MRILALQANQQPDSLLHLDREMREIKRSLAKTSAWGVEFVHEGAVEASELQAILLKYKPDVVHFSGHCATNGDLVLETNEGDPEPLSPKFLGNIFSSLKDPVCCVVLNACYSARLAEAVARFVPCVVGMTSQVTDVAALAFSASFYQALALGTTFEQAFAFARQRVELEARDEAQLLKMFKRTRRNADRATDSLQPFIEAEFDLDKKKRPRVNNNGEYQFAVSVAQYPRTAHTCVYQYLDEWHGTIRKKHQFEVIPNDRRGFESEASLYGNVLVRASLWSTEGGLALQTYLVDALKRRYRGRTSSHIKRALKQITEQ